MAGIRLGGEGLEALADPRFRRFWASQAISVFGDSLVPVTLVFTVLRSGGSPADVGLVLASGAVSQSVLYLFGGGLADRLPRIQIMVVTNGIQTAVFAVFALLVFTRSASVPELAIGWALASANGAVFRPAAGAMVKDLAPAKLSQGANALIGLSQSSGGIVGPVIAGLLISVASPGYSFVLDAVSFVISSVLLIKLSVPATTPRAASPNFWRDLAGGASLVLDRSWFLVNIVGHGLWNLGIAVFFVVGPVVCEERLGGARAWGIISAAVSVGFVLGGVVVLRIRPKRLLVVGNLALVLTAVPMLVLTTTRLPVIVVLTAVAFTGPAVLNGLWATAVRSIYPTEVLGRVLSYDMLVSSVMMPVGFAVSGPVSEHYGPRAALVGAALVIAVPSLAVAGLGSVRRIVRQPDGTIADIGAPSRASAGGQLDPRPEDGQRSAADPPVDVPPGHSVTPDSAR